MERPREHVQVCVRVHVSVSLSCALGSHVSCQEIHGAEFVKSSLCQRECLCLRNVTRGVSACDKRCHRVCGVWMSQCHVLVFQSLVSRSSVPREPSFLPFVPLPSGEV